MAVNTRHQLAANGYDVDEPDGKVATGGAYTEPVAATGFAECPPSDDRSFVEGVSLVLRSKIGKRSEVRLVSGGPAMAIPSSELIW
jgi:hypothetical protein